MRTNWVREKVRSGQPVVGCSVVMGSPSVAELLGQSGFDYLVIDAEHAALDSGDIQQMLMAVNGSNAVPLVRTMSSDPALIQRALNIGAMGVVVPNVKTVEEVRGIVAATRFPPQGERGWACLRAAGYFADSEAYLYHANDNILVVLLVETKEAVENLEEIAAVPGVDVLHLGLYDLCLSIGLDPMRMPYPETEAVIEKALALGRRTGTAIGFPSGTPEEVIRRRAQGFTWLTYSSDCAMIGKAARNGMKEIRRALSVEVEVSAPKQ